MKDDIYYNKSWSVVHQVKEVWKDGKEHTFYRDSRGHFAKSPTVKVVPETTQERITPHREIFYRASVFVEVPYHGKPEHGIHNYEWFGIIQIDYKENISIEDLKTEVKELLVDELGYQQSEFWFDITYSIEYPHPYDAYQPSKHKEAWCKERP